MKKLGLAAVGVAALLTLVVLEARAPSQASSASPPAFEAASLKPNKSGAAGSGINLQPGGRFLATNVTLRQLIAAAYSVAGPPLPDFQISGGPNWAGSDRFDIVAKAAGDVPEGPNGGQLMRPMLQTLLADRFQLTVHHEMRELPIYALLVARSDGTLGPALHRTEADCAAAIAAARGNGPPAPGGPFCGVRGGAGRLSLSSIPMSTLATNLSRSVNRVVVDRTGLAGNFDGSLEWTPDQATPLGAPPGLLPPPPADGPSIFTALQEQLGLKLDAQRGPVDVLVIDRALPPSAD